MLQVIGLLFVSGAVYGGIRVEQRAMMRDIVRHEKAIERMNERLNGCSGCDRRRHDAG